MTQSDVVWKDERLWVFGVEGIPATKEEMNLGELPIMMRVNQCPKCSELSVEIQTYTQQETGCLFYGKILACDECKTWIGGMPIQNLKTEEVEWRYFKHPDVEFVKIERSSESVVFTRGYYKGLFCMILNAQVLEDLGSWWWLRSYYQSWSCESGLLREVLNVCGCAWFEDVSTQKTHYSTNKLVGRRTEFEVWTLEAGLVGVVFKKNTEQALEYAYLRLSTSWLDAEAKPRWRQLCADIDRCVRNKHTLSPNSLLSQLENLSNLFPKTIDMNKFKTNLQTCLLKIGIKNTKRFCDER